MRSRSWPVIAVAMLLASGLGSCAGAVAGHYTVTGMLPLGPSGSVPDYLAEREAARAVAAPVPTVADDHPRYLNAGYYSVD
ncbi:hypothetical protein FPZ54_12205 [Sphingomonas suaedae]|uniref:Uncharacterized protein n=1 Tax=Sphingomonas suaedae TaxID=2599297 RepID=A0A518RGW4_9SPHN|nr:hypothetical protein [Sphingomonas suaedae]QDX26697.1 hypothetical protein FPZ54_12205 [Sphingomonas suaedae]